MSIPLYDTWRSFQPEPNNDADPADSPDPLNYDNGGPGGFDSFAVPQFVPQTMDQETTVYIYAIRVPTTALPHNAGVHPIVTLQFDFPKQPDWYVIDLLTLADSGNPHYENLTIGQNTPGFPNADDVFTVIGARGTGDNKDRFKAIVHGESQHVFLTFQECINNVSSGGGILDGTIYAVTGVDPRIVGVIF